MNHHRHGSLCTCSRTATRRLYKIYIAKSQVLKLALSNAEAHWQSAREQSRRRVCASDADTGVDHSKGVQANAENAENAESTASCATETAVCLCLCLFCRFCRFCPQQPRQSRKSAQAEAAHELREEKEAEARVHERRKEHQDDRLLASGWGSFAFACAFALERV